MTENAPITNKVETLRRVMCDLPQAVCPVTHHFHPGLYIRETLIPAGVVAIGKEHKDRHTSILLSGTVMVLKSDGSTETLTAPRTMLSPPGRKVVYALTDVLWQNVYATDETDLAVLEETYVEKEDNLLTEGQKRLIQAMEAV